MPVVTGATVNGSTLWRHPDNRPGAEGATYIYQNIRISQVKGQRRYRSEYIFYPYTHGIRDIFISMV